MKKKHILVVGIGLNGSCVCNELIKKKYKVTAIDSYDFLEKSFFNKKLQKTDFSKIKNSFQILKSLIQNNSIGKLKNPIIYRLNSLISNKEDNIISVSKNKFKTYEINKIGGRGHLWGRVSPRYPINEFKNKNGWPLKYDEIKNFYSELEKKFKLTGSKKLMKKFDSGNVIGDKKFNQIENKFINIVEKKWKNRKATVLPTLNYDSGPLNPMLKEIIKDRNFSIIKNSLVTKIITNNKGEAKGVEIVDRVSLKKNVIFSDFIFLSASPLETIKILLNSKSKKFKNGIGNNKKLLGKKFFDHIGIAYTGFLRRNSKHLIKKRFDPLNPNKLNNGFYFSPFRKYEKKIKSILNYSIHGTIDNNRNIISIYSFADCPKENKNSLSLEKNKKDKYGIPSIKVNFNWSKNQITTWRDQKKVISELLSIISKDLKINLYQSKSNYKIFKNLPNPGFSHHESGGAIMGNSSKKSVVNKLGQIWDCRNVYICDQSIFPRLNYVNPTLTSMAISLRSARLFTKRYKNKL